MGGAGPAAVVAANNTAAMCSLFGHRSDSRTPADLPLPIVAVATTAG
jgi:hypothetical protein